MMIDSPQNGDFFVSRQMHTSAFHPIRTTFLKGLATDARAVRFPAVYTPLQRLRRWHIFVERVDGSLLCPVRLGFKRQEAASNRNLCRYFLFCKNV